MFHTSVLAFNRIHHVSAAVSLYFQVLGTRCKFSSFTEFTPEQECSSRQEAYLGLYSPRSAW